jgi:hypothetical protein
MLNSIASFVLRSVISALKNAGCSKMNIARNALMNAIPAQMNAEKCPVCNFFLIPVKIFFTGITYQYDYRRYRPERI